MTLLAFNNDCKLKADLLVELHKHRAADSIIKGTYGDKSENVFRGCAVGCSLNSYNIVKGLDLDPSEHLNYEKFGIPTLLARLEDSIFEGLPSTHNIDWPLNFMAAINVGSDLSTVWPKFAQWLMTDETYGVIQYAKTDAQKDSIQKISDLYKNGGSKEAFLPGAATYYASYAASAAANASYVAANASYVAVSSSAGAASANAAAAYSASSAASANAAYAADDASYVADAAADVAASAFADATYYADAVAKRFAVRISQSEYLIKLLKECK